MNQQDEQNQYHKTGSPVVGFLWFIVAMFVIFVVTWNAVA